jgi:hypothetical protein
MPEGLGFFGEGDIVFEGRTMEMSRGVSERESEWNEASHEYGDWSEYSIGEAIRSMKPEHLKVMSGFISGEGIESFCHRHGAMNLAHNIESVAKKVVDLGRDGCRKRRWAERVIGEVVGTVGIDDEADEVFGRMEVIAELAKGDESWRKFRNREEEAIAFTRSISKFSMAEEGISRWNEEEASVCREMPLGMYAKLSSAEVDLLKNNPGVLRLVREVWEDNQVGESGVDFTEIAEGIWTLKYVHGVSRAGLEMCAEKLPVVISKYVEVKQEMKDAGNRYVSRLSEVVEKTGEVFVTGGKRFGGSSGMLDEEETVLLSEMAARSMGKDRDRGALWKKMIMMSDKGISIKEMIQLSEYLSDGFLLIWSEKMLKICLETPELRVMSEILKSKGVDQDVLGSFLDGFLDPLCSRDNYYVSWKDHRLSDREAANFLKDFFKKMESKGFSGTGSTLGMVTHLALELRMNKSLFRRWFGSNKKLVDGVYEVASRGMFTGRVSKNLETLLKLDEREGGRLLKEMDFGDFVRVNRYISGWSDMSENKKDLRVLRIMLGFKLRGPYFEQMCSRWSGIFDENKEMSSLWIEAMERLLVYSKQIDWEGTGEVVSDIVGGILMNSRLFNDVYGGDLEMVIDFTKRVMVDKTHGIWSVFFPSLNGKSDVKIEMVCGLMSEIGVDNLADLDDSKIRLLIALEDMSRMEWVRKIVLEDLSGWEQKVLAMFSYFDDVGLMVPNRLIDKEIAKRYSLKKNGSLAYRMGELAKVRRSMSSSEIQEIRLAILETDEGKEAMEAEKEKLMQRLLVIKKRENSDHPLNLLEVALTNGYEVEYENIDDELRYILGEKYKSLMQGVGMAFGDGGTGCDEIAPGPFRHPDTANLIFEIYVRSGIIDFYKKRGMTDHFNIGHLPDQLTGSLVRLMYGTGIAYKWKKSIGVDGSFDLYHLLNSQGLGVYREFKGFSLMTEEAFYKNHEWTTYLYWTLAAFHRVSGIKKVRDLGGHHWKDKVEEEMRMKDRGVNGLDRRLAKVWDKFYKRVKKGYERNGWGEVLNDGESVSRSVWDKIVHELSIVYPTVKTRCLPIDKVSGRYFRKNGEVEYRAAKSVVLGKKEWPNIAAFTQDMVQEAVDEVKGIVEDSERGWKANAERIDRYSGAVRQKCVKKFLRDDCSVDVSGMTTQELESKFLAVKGSL